MVVACSQTLAARYGRDEPVVDRTSCTTGKHFVGHLNNAIQTATTTAKFVREWIPGFFRRAVSADAVALGIDSLEYGVVQMPSVVFDLSMDLSVAILQSSPRLFLQQPRRAVAETIQRSLDALGGGFVKIAQVIAHSPALFPQSLVDACSVSLAHATTTSTLPADVQDLLEKELALNSLDDIFQHFEFVPMASASIAQVHRSRLKTGEECVVKLVRPKVKERLLADFQALLLVARLGDLVLGKEVVEALVNRSLEACVDELYRCVMAECDLTLERQNMDTFRMWMNTSPSLRRMGLHTSVVIPQTYAHASGEKVLTMDFVQGPTLSEVSTDSSTSPDLWQDALVRALTVAALSVVDGPALFHADLHSGNMIMATGPSDSIDHVAFIDFGCCGQLPRPLRNCLMMQASAFMSAEPDVKQFAEGFAYALDRIPGLGQQSLNVDDLARALGPLLQEMVTKNPFRPGANAMDPELHMLAFKLQKELCCHGVQLPAEFTLLLKTACFGALYFSLLDEEHRDELLRQLAFSGAAYALSHPREATSTLSRGTMLAYGNLLCAKRNAKIANTKKALICCATTASIPLLYLAAYYLI